MRTVVITSDEIFMDGTRTLMNEDLLFQIKN